MRQDIDIEKLRHFFRDNTVPKVKQKPKTFLGIARQPHYENVLSNIYAFFFAQDEEHRFNDLFIKSLLQLIFSTAPGETKNGLKSFEEYEVHTEYPSLKKGRIDLLLTNKEQAIIIENKVYHHLNNDLEDYWTTIKTNDKNKIGIVLSLKPISNTGHEHFINITHLQLLQKVIENSGPYFFEAPNKFTIFLKDFYQNSINLSQSIVKAEDIKFYFSYKKEINQLQKLKTLVHDHLAQQAEEAQEQVPNTKLYSPTTHSSLVKRVRYYTSTFDEDLMIVVVFNQIVENNTVYIAVEFKNKRLVDKEPYKQVVFSKAEKEFLVDGFYSNKNTSWAHFAINKYTFPDESTDFKDFILKKLKDDHLLSIFNKLNTFLKEEERKKATT